MAFDLYQHVTDTIIASIHAGTPAWRKPWTGDTGGAAFPRRATAEPYRSINVLMLGLTAADKGYRGAHWFTYRQAQDAGSQVRKGEKSSTVVKYGTFEREAESSDDPRIIPISKPIACSTPSKSTACPPSLTAPPLKNRATLARLLTPNLRLYLPPPARTFAPATSRARILAPSTTSSTCRPFRRSTVPMGILDPCPRSLPLDRLRELP